MQSVFSWATGGLAHILERLEHCFKWGVFDRAPVERWSKGRITLLGDAAHPMTPFMGQGGAMAIEDAWALARRLRANESDPVAALRSYEETRIPRTARVQHESRLQGEILRSLPGPGDKGERRGVDIDWLYRYDVTQE